MKLALIQTKQNALYNFIDQNRRWSADEAGIHQSQMLEQNYKMIGDAIEHGAEMVVTSEAINFAGLPEQFDGNYAEFIRSGQDNICRQLANAAKRGVCWIIAGMYRSDAYGLMRNSACVWNSSGKLEGIYDKVHLAGSENTTLAAGSRYPVFDTPFGRIGLCICWDMQFPECARALSLQGADMIICPTWGWEGIYGHARAYENGVYAAAAMAIPFWMDIKGIRSPSQVIAPDGTLLACAGRQEPQVLYCEVNIRDCTTYRTLRMDARRPDTYEILTDKQLKNDSHF